MQLGELQNQLDRFNRRNSSIVAISVDSPADSLAMIKRLGLTFALASDPEQKVVKAFGVQNPDTRELALHAVYIVDPAGKIFYRKVARRRPVSAELIDAIDAQRGQYPKNDPVAPRRRIDVAYPQNNFQAIMTIARVDRLPAGVNPAAFARVLANRRSHGSDTSLFTFKALVEQAWHSGAADRASLLDLAAWLIRSQFFAAESASEHPAVAAGRNLSQRLARVEYLAAEEQAHRGTDQHDAALHTLAAARAGLTRVRAQINEQAQAWNLRYAKASLRSYREVVNAVTRPVR